MPLSKKSIWGNKEVISVDSDVGGVSLDKMNGALMYDNECGMCVKYI